MFEVCDKVLTLSTINPLVPWFGEYTAVWFILSVEGALVMSI
jgi:hypothetical protein